MYIYIMYCYYYIMICNWLTDCMKFLGKTKKPIYCNSEFHVLITIISSGNRHYYFISVFTLNDIWKLRSFLFCSS